MADEQTNIKNFPVAGAPSNTPRSMPHNLPAEQNLLGAILLDNSVIERIDDRLVAAHFYDPLHGRIYDHHATADQSWSAGQSSHAKKLFFQRSPITLDDDDVDVSQ